MLCQMVINSLKNTWDVVRKGHISLPEKNEEGGRRLCKYIRGRMFQAGGTNARQEDTELATSQNGEEPVWLRLSEGEELKSQR